MEELAQRNIVLDFEIIALMALVIGVLGYSWGRFFLNREPDRSSPFSGIDLVLMFIPAFFFLLMPLVQVLSPLEKAPVDEAKKVSDLVSSLVNLGYFAFIMMLLYAILEWIRNIRIVEVFGLKRLSLPTILLISIISGFASLIICGALLGSFSNDFLNGIFSDLKEQAPVKDFRNATSHFTLALKIGMACLAAPVVEEFLFRGYIYGTVKRFTSPVFAAVVSSALFAAAHAHLPALFPLWGLAIILVISYEATKCLWVPVGIHAFFNAANIILLLNSDSIGRQ